MMLATLSTSSMATIGRAATSRSAKIALLVLRVEASVAVAGLVAAVASAAVSAVVEVSLAVVDLQVDVEASAVLVASAVHLVAVVQASTPVPRHRHRIPSPTSLLLVVSPATRSTCAISHGLRATKISSSSSPPLARSSAPRSSTSPTVVLVEPVLLSLRRLQMQRLLFVSSKRQRNCYTTANFCSAKFTGYQYGGRPLGLTYVKYTNQSNGDVMEGTEHTGGLTQDQIM